MKIIALIIPTILLSGCYGKFRKEASLRCSGGSYTDVFDNGGSLTLEAKAEISEDLLSKGFGTGSAKIILDNDEKNEFAKIAGALSGGEFLTLMNDFTSKYQSCLDDEMLHYYNLKGKEYPQKPKTDSSTLESEVLTEVVNVVAYATETNAAWRNYPVCAKIPDNALMIKDSISVQVTQGVPAGAWGGWLEDRMLTDNNAYGPTKVCQTFAHQIHDQNRSLRMTVNYQIISNL